MRKTSIQKSKPTLPLYLSSFAINAQELDLISPVRKVSEQVEGIFPVIAGIIFLIVAMVNIGHFTKEGGDWKKGLINIIICVVIIGLISGLYKFITSIQL